MRRLLTAAVSFFISYAAAQAAEITVLSEGTSEHPAIISIQGPFAHDAFLNETNAFSILAPMQKHGAIVFLDSPGGSIRTALWIGMLVQEHGFTTAVADKAQCASACALIWLAGKERYMGHLARVGFHSVRRTADKNDTEPFELGNRMVTVYLRKIGVAENAAAWVISAPPTSMTWVSPERLATYGIFASYLNSSEEKWSWMRVTWPIPRQRKRGVDSPNPTQRLFRQWMTQEKPKA